MVRVITLTAWLALLVLPRSGVGQQVGLPADSLRLIDSLYSVIRSRSVHRSRIDWTIMDTVFRRRLKAQPTFARQLLEFRYLLERLDDVHSAIISRGQQISHFRPVSPEHAAYVRPLIERASARTGQASATLLDGGVGYAVIPTVYTAGRHQADSVAQAFRSRLCGLTPVPRDWILDLRLNMGGNMHPMFASLAPILGDGELGGIVDAHGSRSAHWRVVRGAFLADDVATATVERTCTLPAGGRVAVLLGPITISSGEALAIAFRGRPGTRLFGEPTPGGYTTANHWHVIGPDLVLNLSEGFFVDRTGTVYRTRVDPDSLVAGGDAFDNLHQDAKVKAALEWIRASGRRPD